MQSTKKRSDVQVLRGVSIISVFLFHLNSSYFPNGYLGVDVFFIISGYLISSILAKESSIGFGTILQFYQKRLKRIVPLYATVLFMITISSILIFFSIDMDKVVRSMKWSMIFARNLQQIHDQSDYWSDSLEFPILLHGWSLSVEIQFYIIAPFIILYSHNTPIRRFAIIATIFIGSMIIHIKSDETYRFNSTWSRLWQFMIGFMVSELSSSKKEEVYIDSVSDKSVNEESTIIKQRPFLSFIMNLSFITLIVILFLGVEINRIGARFSVSFFSGIIIILGQFGKNFLLHNNVLSYIGDISYSLYLIHWPVIIFYQYYCRIINAQANFGVAIEFIFYFSVSFLLAISLYYKVERKMARVSFMINLIYVMVIYLTISVLYFNHEKIQKSMMKYRNEEENIPVYITNTSNTAWKYSQKEITDAIEWNTNAEGQWKIANRLLHSQHHIETDTEVENWIGYSKSNSMNMRNSYIAKGRGKAKVLLLGNSFASSASPVLLDVFDNNFSYYRLYSYTGCRVLTRPTQPRCHKYIAEVQTIVKKMKPDFTFIMAREPEFFEYNTTTLRSVVNENLEIISNSSGKVIIDSQSEFHFFYSPKTNPVHDIIRRLQRQVIDLTGLSKTTEEVAKKHKNEWDVMTSLKYHNIIHNNISAQLCNNEFCPIHAIENSYGQDKLGAFMIQRTFICIMLTTTAISQMKLYKLYDLVMMQL